MSCRARKLTPPTDSELNNPDRPKVSSFVKSVFGDNYHNNWNHWGNWDSFNPVTNDKSGISSTIVRAEEILKNLEIESIIFELIETRKECYPQIIESSLTIWKDYHNYTKDDIKSFAESMINKPITYNDLYYTYLLKHEVNKINIYKDTSFVQSIIEPFGNFIDFDCNQKFNNAYQDVCQAWCNIKINAEDPYVLEYQEETCGKWMTPLAEEAVSYSYDYN